MPASHFADLIENLNLLCFAIRSKMARDTKKKAFTEQKKAKTENVEVHEDRKLHYICQIIKCSLCFVKEILSISKISKFVNSKTIILKDHTNNKKYLLTDTNFCFVVRGFLTADTQNHSASAALIRVPKIKSNVFSVYPIYYITGLTLNHI